MIKAQKQHLQIVYDLQSRFQTPIMCFLANENQFIFHLQLILFAKICKLDCPPQDQQNAQTSYNLRILYHSYIDFVLRKLDVQYQWFYLL